MRMIPLIALAFALAACGGPTAGNTAPAADQAPSEFQKRVAALSAPERNAVFIRAIRDAGFDCQGVTKSEPKPEAAGDAPLWHASCSGGATYGVLIGRDGTATVVGAR